MVKIYMETENNLLMDESLRLMRIREQPLHSSENLLVVDRLEKGVLQFYEYMGGSLYISSDTDGMSQCSNAALVAELKISIKDEKKEVGIERIFNEYGYDYVHLLTCQVIHFAEFYGYSAALLDLGKPNQKGA